MSVSRCFCFPKKKEYNRWLSKHPNAKTFKQTKNTLQVFPLLVCPVCLVCCPFMCCQITMMMPLIKTGAIKVYIHLAQHKCKGSCGRQYRFGYHCWAACAGTPFIHLNLLQFPSNKEVCRNLIFCPLGLSWRCPEVTPDVLLGDRNSGVSLQVSVKHL